jgi:hypothetical protein
MTVAGEERRESQIRTKRNQPVCGNGSSPEARRLFERARAMLWRGDEAERAA